MKTQSKTPIFAVAGLSTGLLATLLGMHMSSAIQLTPALLGIVTAVWGAASAGIVSSQFKKSPIAR